MGLDMYLNRKVYIGANYDSNKTIGEINITKKGIPVKVNFNKVTYITEEFLYWRKQNHIHKWFVDNVQDGEDDCKNYYVSTENLIELRNTCQQVLDDNSLAEELLPTASGFFFGSTEYNEDYYYSLKELIENLKDIENEDDLVDFEYSSSW